MKQLNIALCALLTACVALPALAKDTPTGTITTANGSTRGSIRWKNAAKEYVLTNDKKMTVTYKADEVESVNIDRPASLDGAIKKVQTNSGLAAAIATLEEIAKDYSHLTYDQEATGWLAKGYLLQGNAAKAIAACEAVIRDNPEAAYKGATAVSYWEALIKDGKSAKLNILLDKAIASGDKDAAATALVKRGDAAMARGSARANCEEALRDGYLRVILLYADPSSDAYAEALYKGAKAFEGMSQSSQANRLREQLKQECPTSSWARAK